MFQIGSVFPNCRRDATDSSSSRRSLVQTFLEVGHRRLLHPLLCATAYPLRIGTAGGRSDGSSYSTLAEPRNNPHAMSPSIRSAGTILSNRISVHALGRGAAQTQPLFVAGEVSIKPDRALRGGSQSNARKLRGASELTLSAGSIPIFHGAVMPNSPARPSRRLGPQPLVEWICVFTLFRPILTHQLAGRPAEHGDRKSVV